MLPAITVVPVPLSAAVAGEPAALCVTVNVSELGPTLDGVNVTLIVQFAPDASVLGLTGQFEEGA